MRGFLRKMAVDVSGDNLVQYSLRLDDDQLLLNPLIGHQLSLSFSGSIQCIHCGRSTKKSYSQGYCYPCFKKLAQCDLCVVSPERCHYEAGTCRDDEFAQRFCMQEHIVYLANSSGVKVGITKPENLPTRWIDQGAVQALPIIRVMTRQQSGFVEEAFKEFVSDKTQWQQMLKSEDRHVDLHAEKERLLQQVNLAPTIDRFGIQAIQLIPESEVATFRYPVDQYPTKVTSISFDKTQTVTGKLLGIKGQYLIFDIGVINLRRFTSYEIEFSHSHASDGEQAEQLSLL